MKNWNTDVSKKDVGGAKDRVWTRWKTSFKKKVLTYWNEIKDIIEPENRRLLEFYIWGKLYSLPPNVTFWK